MLWTRTKKHFSLVPSEFLHMLLVLLEKAISPLPSYRSFNPYFQCIPAGEVACKHVVSDHPCRQQARTCGKEISLGQECVNCLALALPSGAVCCTGDFPLVLPVPASQLGAFSHKDVASGVPSSL